MRIVTVIFLTLFCASCVDTSGLEKAVDGGQATQRINNSERNNEHLFKELD